MSLLLAVPFALLVDRLIGEPHRYHPLVGFGKAASRIESKMNTGNYLILRGLLSWLVAVLPLTIFIYYLDQQIGGIWLSIFFGWLAIGWKSLREHGLAVYDALSAGKIKEARLKTSYLVSRDTNKLNESDLSKATIESILENGSDAIIAPAFWLLLFGAPGVVLYRLTNTLDAMWGYRNQQFEYFGKTTAIIDDILNYIPARITALLYLISGNSTQAWHTWQTQGPLWYSPNAGIVMAAGAGALIIKLGGNAIYHGHLKSRPTLGNKHAPQHHDIKRAIKLVDKSVLGVTVISFLLYTSPLVFILFGK